MERKVSREYVDEPRDEVVVDNRRHVYFNPVSALVAIVLLSLLIWAVVWGPIHDIFDGNGSGPKIDKPTLNQ